MGIDLNTIEEEEEEEEPEQLTGLGAAPAAADAPQAVSVCLELWHACAGPRIWLPKKGSLLVYLPQGHLEYLGFSGVDCDGGRWGACRFDVPPHVFCRVMDINLHADVGTDEVYARLSLVSESEESEGRVNKGETEGEEGYEDSESMIRSSTPHMFCKTLTASDTSTHGGFSVPRRAAEDCFPPLDYKQQRPSQELTAKDLHGTEWRFRHIYRGQPRRHLLTTGWSAFVNRKKLISGDAVLFLRGDDGVLRLGVRRAAQSKGCIPVPEHQNPDVALTTLAVVSNAVSMKKVFYINYNPRTSSSAFVVPYWKFIRSSESSLCVGTSFKMLYENDAASERRPTGLITGIRDIDPQRWPGSKWRCLLVNWDDDVDTNRRNQISPWEIESTGSVVGSASLSTTGSKRAKLCLPPVSMDYPILNGNGCLDLRESASFHKVLQGQELMRLKTPNNFGFDAHIQNLQYSEGKGYPCNANRCMTSESVSEGSRIRIPDGGSDFSLSCTGFREPIGFLGVLQGQEVFSKVPPFLGARSDAHTGNGKYGLFDSVQTSHAGKSLPALSVGYGALVQPSLPLIQASSPSSVLMFQEANSKTSLLPSNPSQERHDGNPFFLKTNGVEAMHKKEGTFGFWPSTVGYHLANEQHKLVKIHDPIIIDGKVQREKGQDVSQNGCRLFGFPLTERIPEANLHEKPLPFSPSSTPGKLDIGFTTSPMPQMPAKPVGCSCIGASSLYALCAAPF
ncbi:auxin response factor 2-like [Curcuma longa]|uniref:auxin response factor 2-like n=1 Tax=Curcuma longa TaxID=136217 RepID=UPI003D9DF8F6